MEVLEAILVSYRRWLKGELIGQYDGELYNIYTAAMKQYPREMERVREEVFRKIPR